MRKKAVIFDFNGTMFFDTMFQLNAWNRVLEDYDMDPIPEQEYRDVLCGRGSEETVRYVWGENLTKEQSDEYRNKKKEYYQQLCLADPEHFQLVPGLETYLDALRDSGVLFTIATSSSPYSVDFYFEHMNLGRWFRRDKIVCNDRIERGKPAPDLFLVAAEELGVDPADCLVFEDSNAGVRSANTAGIGSVIVIDPECRFSPELDLKFDAVYPNFRAVFLENTVECADGE